LLPAALLVVGGGAYALASAKSQTITVCVKHQGGIIYQAPRCAKHDKKLSWSTAPAAVKATQGVAGATGSQGPQGDTGPQGPAGATGPQGPQGPAGTNGTNGLPGERGPSDAYTAGNGTSSGSTTPVDISVPAGSYFVIAKATITSASVPTTNTECDLSGGTGSDETFGSVDENTHPTETLVATMVTTFSAPGTIQWTCNTNLVAISHAVMNAIQVGTVH